VLDQTRLTGVLGGAEHFSRQSLGTPTGNTGRHRHLGRPGRRPKALARIVWGLELFADQQQAFEAAHKEAWQPTPDLSGFEFRGAFKELTEHDLGL
jgi:hypothetical protein